jgi:hypothetical protein
MGCVFRLGASPIGVAPFRGSLRSVLRTCLLRRQPSRQLARDGGFGAFMPLYSTPNCLNQHLRNGRIFRTRSSGVSQQHPVRSAKREARRSGASTTKGRREVTTKAPGAEDVRTMAGRIRSRKGSIRGTEESRIREKLKTHRSLDFFASSNPRFLASSNPRFLNPKLVQRQKDA